MAGSNFKVPAWKAWVLMPCAILIGVSLRPYGEYRRTGEISTASLVIAGLTAVFGILILVAMVRYFNRPEKDDGGAGREGEDRP